MQQFLKNGPLATIISRARRLAAWVLLLASCLIFGMVVISLFGDAQTISMGVILALLGLGPSLAAFLRIGGMAAVRGEI